jgi:hypothetical protein
VTNLNTMQIKEIHLGMSIAIKILAGGKGKYT